MSGHKSLGFVIVVIAVVCVFVIVFLAGQVLSPHHYEQMSQRSEVSEITIKISSLNVFKPGCNILFFFYLIEFSEYEVKLRMAEDEALEDTMIDIVEVVCNYSIDKWTFCLEMVKIAM